MTDCRQMFPVLEEALGTRLEAGKVRLARTDNHALAAAGWGLHEYYQNTRFPEKPMDTLRPFISPSLIASGRAGMDYVSGSMNFDKSSNYRFREDTYGGMSRSIKRYLLYAHELCIVDPLPHLLDFFRIDPDGEEALGRRPAVLALLTEYASLRPLVEEGILFPISEPIMGPLADPPLTEDLIGSLQRSLPSVDRVDLTLVTRIVAREWKRRRTLDERIDLFLPKSLYVDVMRELFHKWEQSFSANAIREPLELALLGQLPAVDVEHLSIEDAVRIRRDEDLFAEWRTVLKGVLDRLHSRQGEYTDIEREFADGVREEMRAWRRKALELGRGSGIMSKLFSKKRSISIGITSGAITGALSGGPPGSAAGAAAGGAVGAAVAPALELLADIAGGRGERERAAVMRSHFLAVGGTLE